MTLYLVPTPIGNLDDITLRALKVLGEVDRIACEDTRKTGRLLKHFDIDTPMISYHDHNEVNRAPQIVGFLKAGEAIALVSDAGSPGISDPGFYLVRECIRADIEVQILPGATAFVPALTVSGLPSERFVFEGFLPHKKGRKGRIEELAAESRTIILYESPHRIAKTLSQLADAFGPDRACSVSREISKMYEETVRGTLDEVQAHFAESAARGEFVIVVAGTSYTAP